MTLLEIIEHRCRYRQTARVGPLAIRQELELSRTSNGPLVNRIVGGRFTGGEIVFSVEPAGQDAATVEARLRVPLRGLSALATPVLQRRLRSGLATGLAEDKDDLENGWYSP